MTQNISYDDNSDGWWSEEEIPSRVKQYIIPDLPPSTPLKAKPRVAGPSTLRQAKESRPTQVAAQPIVNPVVEQGRSNGIRQAFSTHKLSNTPVKQEPKKKAPAPPPRKQIVISDDETDKAQAGDTDVDSGVSTDPPLLDKPTIIEPPSTPVHKPTNPSSSTPNPPRPAAKASSNHGTSRVLARPLKKNASLNVQDLPPRAPLRPKEDLSGHPAPPECDDPPTNGQFQKGRIGIDLNIEVIAHDAAVQQLMDDRRMGWGVQYEIARGISGGHWTWEAVREKMDRLPTKNIEAWRVVAVLKGSPPAKVDYDLWRELDREQEAIQEGKGRGLGLMGEWHGDHDWYGGKIQQLARLVRNGNEYAIQLMPMEKRRSHRFARFLGSRRIIQLKVPDELVNEENMRVRKWLGKKFVVCGRVFVPFHSKDSSVYMMETNENHGRESAAWCGDQFRLSFAQFINWHNPLDLNQNQPISKWSTRFAIGLSNSAPAIEFRSKNIFMIDDLYSPTWDRKSKPTAEQTMTDGCGFMNRAALRIITRRFGYPSLVTAVQGRVMNAKGLWIIHPTDSDPEPRIWIRDSQNKIKLPYLDRAHRIFDLLAASKPSGPVALSRQSIINLSFNGVPNKEFIELQKQGLTQEVLPLMAWGEDKEAMVHLANEVSRNGSVVSTRAARLGAEKSRLLGLVGREWGHDFIELHDAKKATDMEETTTGAYTGRSDNSGAPFSFNESAYELMQAGFSPLYFEPLRMQLRWIIQNTIVNAIEKYRIPIEEGLSAFVVPDPIGVLKEGEIFYRSSQMIKDPDTDTFYDILLGEVVVGRYPIRLPSDMQRVKAVDAPELHDWTDVIVVPTVGNVSFASLLSGGDYDGDEPFIIRQKSLVEAFKNKPLTVAPDHLMTFFEKEVEKVTEFNDRADGLGPKKAQFEFQQVLLLGLYDSKVGLYSNFHDFAVWKLGYDHPDTILIAYIFAILLDSSKTGHRLKPGTFRQHQIKFGSKIIDEQKPDFVLAALKVAGKELQEHLMRRYDEQVEQLSKVQDPHLREPYDKQVNAAKAAREQDGFPGLEKELNILRNHVEQLYSDWLDRLEKLREEKGSQDVKLKKSKNGRKEDDMARLSKDFHTIPSSIKYTTNALEVMVSYAYAEKRSTHFVMNIAFQELCLIKAKAMGIAPCIRLFDETKIMASTCLRALPKPDPLEEYGGA